MKVNEKRLSRYLRLQKKINSYLLKLRSRDRNMQARMAELVYLGINLENKLRESHEEMLKIMGNTPNQG